MKAVFLLIACMLTAAPALAEDKPAGMDATPTAEQLDLSLPKSTNGYRNDPPGAWYGDTSGVPASAASREDQQVAREDQCEGKLHGSVAAGIGYSSRGGNSNWQAVNMNSCKTYYNDEGEAREVGVSISVGQFDGNGWRGGHSFPAPPPRR